MRYIYVVLFTVFLVGCSSKDIEVSGVVQHEVDEEKAVYDLLNIPQEIGYFTKNIHSSETLYDIQKKYEKYYFNIWNNSKPRESLSEIKWPFNAYRASNGYGENLQPLGEDFFKFMLDNANFDSFASVNKNAITLKHSNIRAFPTIKPLLMDPSKAGEGFPFDYLQNSSIHANKPVFISHYSKDGEWVYIFSSFTSGWLKTQDIVLLEKEHTDIWQRAEQVYLTKEGISLYGEHGEFLFKSKIGMMLALIEEDKDNYTALAISKYKNKEPLFSKVKLPKDIASKDVLKFNATNLERIISDVAKSKYGWGGMYGQRDCSSSMRDIFAPFGIWLPRNSLIQSMVGKVIMLDGLTNEEKIKTIKEKAIPFQTLLYKKGHIVLYIGTYNDEIVIFHNTWGIRTSKEDVEGRVIIGKSIISTLKLGKNQKYYDENAELLRNLKSMNILTM